MNAAGIQNASQLASAGGMASLARFEQCDVSKKLPFPDKTFDAVFANDVLCHVRGRSAVLREIFRVLTPGGRMLFSDALVIGGMVSHEEIATRSSIGFYVYSPPGENERVMKQAGFKDVRVTDTTDCAASIADRWRIARENKKEELILAEGKENFEGLQRFLSCVHTLMDEKRLLRNLYIARRPA
jgi:ubiquinone/menaquinone biosynthesis C-methylase UbiE